MSSRSEQIRKRIAKRKKERDRLARTISESQKLFPYVHEKVSNDRYASYEETKDEGIHPLFRKEVFLFKILLSAILVFVVAILFRNENARLETVRDFVGTTMEEDFQFTTVANWYEQQFGKPLALLPFTGEDKSENLVDNPEYALPASGKILEDFGENGQRVIIETPKGSAVTAMRGGMVEFAGVKEGFGKTVVVQHSDKSETWYGNLEEITVDYYDYIEKGKEIGTAKESVDGTKSSFYFARKEGNQFVDPFQVMEVE